MPESDDALDWDDRNFPGAAAALAALNDPDDYDTDGCFQQVLDYMWGCRNYMAALEAENKRKDAALDPRDLEVLCALTRVWLRDGRATVSTVAREAGISREPTWQHLQHLRNAGLVCTGRGRLRPGEVS